MLLAAFAAACGADTAPDQPLTLQVTDSAGIQLVRNLDARVDTLAVELVEELRIGNIDGPTETQFHIVTGVAVDEAGRIFVIDQGTRAVRLFDRDGAFIRQFGGPGDGPGEFRRIARLFLTGDTLHVADASTRFGRGVLFDTTGALLGTYASRLENGSVLTPSGALPAGWVVQDDSALGSQYRERAGDVTRHRVSFALVDPRHLERVMTSRAAADSLLAPLVAYEWGRLFWELGSEGGSERFPLGNPPLFEPSPRHAIDGRGFVHIARGWPYAVDTYDEAGRLVRRVTRAHDSIPVTDALVDDVLGRVRAYYDTASGSDFSGAYVKRARYPRIGYLPVTSTVIASADGGFWVRRPDLEPDPAGLEFSRGQDRPSFWDAFDAEGVYLHTTRLDPSFSLRHVGRDAIVGIDRDTFGVQYVVRLGLRPRTGQ